MGDDAPNNNIGWVVLLSSLHLKSPLELIIPIIIPNAIYPSLLAKDGMIVGEPINDVGVDGEEEISLEFSIGCIPFSKPTSSKDEFAID